MNLLDSAISYFDSVMTYTKSIAAAEAKYHICEIAFNRKNYELCEKLIMELVQQKPSYDYWLAKGILLLGDNFTAQKDFFNAKHSVESIIENYDGFDKEELIAEATKSLEYIKTLELENLKEEPVQEELEIELEPVQSSDSKVESNDKKQDTIENNNDENE